MGEILAIMALFMFSANIIVTNIAAKKMDINYGFLLSVLVNILFSVVLFFAHFFFLRTETFHWNSLGFILFLLGGFFSTYLGRFFFFISITKLGPAKASTFQVSNPLFTFIIAWIFLDENLSMLDIIFIFVILVGLFLVNYVPKSLRKSHEAAVALENEQTINESFSMKLVKSAVFIALLSGFSYGIGNVFRGAAIHQWNEPIVGAFLGAIIGAASHILLNPKTRKVLKKKTEFKKNGAILYVISGMLTISAQSCLMGSMFYIPVSIANLITLSTPVIVTPISYFFLKNQEGISKITVAGIVLVLVGISLILL